MARGRKKRDPQGGAVIYRLIKESENLSRKEAIEAAINHAASLGFEHVRLEKIGKTINGHWHVAVRGHKDVVVVAPKTRKEDHREEAT